MGGCWLEQSTREISMEDENVHTLFWVIVIQEFICQNSSNDIHLGIVHFAAIHYNSIKKRNIADLNADICSHEFNPLENTFHGTRLLLEMKYKYFQLWGPCPCTMLSQRKTAKQKSKTRRVWSCILLFQWLLFKNALMMGS